jgi:hypothetical protein
VILTVVPEAAPDAEAARFAASFAGPPDPPDHDHDHDHDRNLDPGGPLA